MLQMLIFSLDNIGCMLGEAINLFSTEMGDRVGFNFRCRTSISVCNQPATQCQLSLPSLRGR